VAGPAWEMARPQPQAVVSVPLLTVGGWGDVDPGKAPPSLEVVVGRYALAARRLPL